MSSTAATASSTKGPKEFSQDLVQETTNDFSGVLAILKFGKGVHLRLLGSILLIVCASMSVMASARILGLLVEALAAVKQSQVVDITGLTASFLAFEAAAVFLQYFGRLGLASATIKITYQVRIELFEKLKRLPMTYFDRQPLGRTITRLTTDVEGIENFFSGTLARLIISTIHIVTVLIAMILTSPKFGIVIVACSLPAIAFSLGMRKPIRHWMRTYRKRSAALNATLAEFLNGIPVIKAFGLEGWTQSKFTTGAQEMLHSAMMMLHWNSLIRPLVVLISSAPMIAIVWWGGLQVASGTLALGLLVTYIRYSERFLGPIRTISQEIQHIQEALISSERVKQMLYEVEEDDALGMDGTVDQTVEGALKFENVWMEYIEGQPILKGINFEVEKGQTIALVGSTGSGKTTTVNLIPKLYPLMKGQITLDGIPLDQWKRKSIRRHLGYVGQDVVIFRGSVRENLLAAVQDGQHVSDEVIMEACRRTGLDEILARFGEGLDYTVLEAGSNLSMGEKQLVAFTRMIIKDPAILILDEATANIDEHCEKLIQKAVSEVMEGRTCFIIAHRLSTIVGCDLTLVFKDGEILEKGTHESLVAQNGVYSDLISHQL